MSEKHTPGPWTVKSYSDTEHVIPAIWGGAPGELSDHIRHIEDARLAAAAPDLLDALQTMLEQFTKTPSTIKDSEARGKAHAAIAKATGGGA